jgi:hypothetical protein
MTGAAKAKGQRGILLLSLTVSTITRPVALNGLRLMTVDAEAQAAGFEATIPGYLGGRWLPAVYVGLELRGKARERA